MTLSSRCVAVVGAGPAGLACARFLRDKGHVPIVFETAASVGGVWGRNPLNTVVYPNLRTNIPTCVMQCQDLPFEDGLPSFVGKGKTKIFIILPLLESKFIFDPKCLLHRRCLCILRELRQTLRFNETNTV